jgi:hypothetical protein
MKTFRVSLDLARGGRWTSLRDRHGRAHASP